MDVALILLRAALLLYAAGFAAAVTRVLRDQPPGRTLAGWLATGGVACHTGALLALGWGLKRCPLATLPEVLSAVAWATVLVSLVIFRLYRVEILHLIVLPTAVVVLMISKILPGDVVPLSASLQASALRFHLTAIILGVAALTTTFATSLLYLVVDRGLKAKRPVRFFRSLPSLERCDRIARLSLLWAFPLLTLGIVTGTIVNEAKYGTPWGWQPRETVAVLAWLLLGVVVVARLGWGWRGRKLAYLTLLGFGMVFLRMLGA